MTPLCRAVWLAAAFGALAVVSASAADRWAVLTDDGVRMASSVEFKADGSGLALRQADGTAASLPLTSVAAVTRRLSPPPSRATRAFFAELPGGERILAERAELAGGKLVLINSRWGRLEFPVAAVRRLVANDSRLPPAPADFTGVRYANGDAVPGNVLSLSDQGAVVDMPGVGKMPVEGWEAVSDVVLSRGGTPAARGAPEVFLRSGEKFIGDPQGGADWFLKLKTNWSADPLSIPFEMLSSIVLSAGRTMLSAAPLKSGAVSSFLGYHHPAARDHALAGGPLSVSGFSAGRGWALYAGTRLDFAVPPAPSGARLVALTGIDDAIPPGMGTAELKVVVDGQTAQSARLDAGGGLVAVNVEAPTNAATISIAAEFGPAGPAGGHVDVLYPCLIVTP